MIRGSGDVIIDIIKKILKNVLCIKDPNVPTDDVMVIDKLFLIPLNKYKMKLVIFLFLRAYVNILIK